MLTNARFAQNNVFLVEIDARLRNRRNTGQLRNAVLCLWVRPGLDLVVTHIVAKRRKHIAVGVSPRIVVITKLLGREAATAIRNLLPPLRGSIHVNIP